MPFGMLALDYMQLSRLEYIIHRWEYLTNNAIPKLDELMSLHSSFSFFESTVIERNRDEVYYRLERLVRTFLIIPTILLSSVSVSVFLLKFGHWYERDSYYVGIFWIILLTGITLLKTQAEKKEKIDKLYTRPLVVIASSVFLLLFFIDSLDRSSSFLYAFSDLLFYESPSQTTR